MGILSFQISSLDIQILSGCTVVTIQKEKIVDKDWKKCIRFSTNACVST